jgi:hypothetical protein
MKKPVDEKQVVFYSEKYDKRAKAERAATIAKVQDLIANPEKYTQATSYGASSVASSSTKSIFIIFPLLSLLIL